MRVSARVVRYGAGFQLAVSSWQMPQVQRTDITSNTLLLSTKRYIYIVVFAVNGLELTSIIYCFLTSALIVLSVIDWRTYEIPFGINIFILVLGILHVFIDHDNWSEYVIGFFCVSLFLEILLLVSGGRAIGGGDVKLMACAGLAIGWQNITLAFFLGCIIGSVIHLIRMKVTNAGNRLAMGPYLAAGIFISMLWVRNDIRHI